MNSRRAAITVLCAVLALLAAAPLPAQWADDFARLRDEHTKALATATRSVDDAFRLMLRQFESERTQAGDYAGAQRIRVRRAAIDREIEATALAVKPSATHTLAAAQALTRDGANSESVRRYIEFKKTGGKALWQILSLEPGWHEVFLTYSVGLPGQDSPSSFSASTTLGEPGGTVAFAESSSLVAGPSAALEKKLMTTGSWDHFIRESLGVHEFKNRSATVRVEALQASDAGLMRLRQVELVRVSQPAPGASSEQAAKAIEDLRARHREALSLAANSLQMRHSLDLDQLERRLRLTGETEKAAEAARERARLSQDTREPPDLIPPFSEPPPAPPPPASASDEKWRLLERHYRTQRETVTRPLLAAYAEKLKTLAAAYDTRRDLRAAAVRQELQRVNTHLAAAFAAVFGESLPLPDEKIQPLTLSGANASPASGSNPARIEAERIDFTGIGSSASWNLPPLPPGRYHLEARLSCTNAEGLTARISIGDLPARAWPISPTGDTTLPVRINLGEIEWAAPPSTLQIDAADIPSRRTATTAFFLHDLTISPVEAPAP